MHRPARIRRTSFDIKIRSKFVKIKNCITDSLVIFVTPYFQKGIDDTNVLSQNMLYKVHVSNRRLEWKSYIWDIKLTQMKMHNVLLWSNTQSKNRCKRKQRITKRSIIDLESHHSHVRCSLRSMIHVHAYFDSYSRIMATRFDVSRQRSIICRFRQMWHSTKYRLMYCILWITNLITTHLMASC